MFAGAVFSAMFAAHILVPVVAYLAKAPVRHDTTSTVIYLAVICITEEGTRYVTRGAYAADNSDAYVAHV